jgi:serine/threonine protein kinase
MTDEAVPGQGPGRVVGGRYRLGRMLGRGGMGAVWQAEDILLARQVALKEMWLPAAGHGSIDPSDPPVRRAIREAQAAARLRHPGIVTVHDVVSENGRPWIVMELVDGRSLADTVQEQGPLTERQTAEIGMRVLDALRVAHDEGVVHRDIKPANILLAGDRMVITDFGIATIRDATALTITGQVIGSPAYLAPERIHGLPATAAADLWALGVTLYTAVTGSSPFQRDTIPATLAAVLNHKPTAPARIGRLWPVIRGLLEKDPARRLNAEQSRELLAVVIQMIDGAVADTRSRARMPGWIKRWASPRNGPPRTTAALATTPATTPAFPAGEAIGQSDETSGSPELKPSGAGTDTATPTGSAATATAPDGTQSVSPEPAGRPRRHGKTTVGGATVAVLILAAAGGLLSIYGPGETPTDLGVSIRPADASVAHNPPAAAGSGQTSRSPTAVPSAAPVSASPSSGASGFDRCLVGTWRSVSIRRSVEIYSAHRWFSGGRGATKRIWPDGRSVEDFADAAALTDAEDGGAYKLTIRGKITENMMNSSPGNLSKKNIADRRTASLTRDGETDPFYIRDTFSDGWEYGCTPTRLTITRRFGNISADYRRITSDP